MYANQELVVNIHNRQKRICLNGREREYIRLAAGAAIKSCPDHDVSKFYAARIIMRKKNKPHPVKKYIKRRAAPGSGLKRGALEVNLLITDDAGIREANLYHRGVDAATDVISFPLMDFSNEIFSASPADIEPYTGRTPIGEIMISAERAFMQAEDYGHSFERELGFLTVHGILHLLGYDHPNPESADRPVCVDEKGDMREITERALASVGLDRISVNDRQNTAAAPTGSEPSPDIVPLPGGTGGSPGYRSGFIAVLGKPNVGKSALINALCGHALAIVTDKPQTTRRNAKMILTTDSYQLIFIDTPGLHSPRNRLGEQMVRRAKASVWDVDAIMLTVDAREKQLNAEDLEALDMARASDTPVALIINKVDLVKKESLLPLIARFNAAYDFACIIPISAIKPGARETVLDEIVKLIPAGEPLYPEDMITDQTERRIFEDVIREKALKLLNQEVPHGVDVEIEKFHRREHDGLYEITATIYCEREQHKKIIIGKNGETLKRIGAAARVEMERMQASKVYLELWVKARKDWRNNDAMLRRMGYFDS